MNNRRQLRRNATDAENRLWYVLRNRGLGGHKLVRQIAIGPFIADSVCRETALIVELDGGQHAESADDLRRTTYLNVEGYGVWRFWNADVMRNRDGVVWAIPSTLEGSPSPNLRFAPATLSPGGRGTRGARAAGGANFLNQPRSVLPPSGVRAARPKGETDEGASPI